MNIKAKNDRLEFIGAIEWLVDLIFDKVENISEIERVAINAYKLGIEVAKNAGFTMLPVERIHELIA